MGTKVLRPLARMAGRGPASENASEFEAEKFRDLAGRARGRRGWPKYSGGHAAAAWGLAIHM